MRKMLSSFYIRPFLPFGTLSENTCILLFFSGFGVTENGPWTCIREYPLVWFNITNTIFSRNSFMACTWEYKYKHTQKNVSRHFRNCTVKARKKKCKKNTGVNAKFSNLCNYVCPDWSYHGGSQVCLADQISWQSFRPQVISYRETLAWINNFTIS